MGFIGMMRSNSDKLGVKHSLTTGVSLKFIYPLTLLPVDLSFCANVWCFERIDGEGDTIGFNSLAERGKKRLIGGGVGTGTSD